MNCNVFIWKKSQWVRSWMNFKISWFNSFLNDYKISEVFTWKPSMKYLLSVSGNRNNLYCKVQFLYLNVVSVVCMLYSENISIFWHKNKWHNLIPLFIINLSVRLDQLIKKLFSGNAISWGSNKSYQLRLKMKLIDDKTLELYMDTGPLWNYGVMGGIMGWWKYGGMNGSMCGRMVLCDKLEQWNDG